MKIAGSASLLLFTALVAAQEPNQPRFIVRTVDGPLAPAPLLRMANDFTLHTGGDQPKQFSGKDLVAIRQASTSLPRFLCQNVLVLNNGDRIPLDVKAGWRLNEDRLYFRPGAPLKAAKQLDLSVNYAAVLCFGPRKDESADEQELLLSRLLPESRTRDVILFMDGDRIEGTLKNLDSVSGAALDINGQETLIPPAKIRAIAFNSEFKARPRSKGPFAQLVLNGGGRLGLSQVRLEAGQNQLAGTTMFGSAVQIPLVDVRALDIRQGPAVYLSDLPCGFQHTAFLKVAWPLMKDASVTGNPLQLGQDTFEKGLGMHSQSRATFQLDGKYRWFETMVGLDERHGQMGRVRLKVLADGKERELGPGPESKNAAKVNGAVCTRQEGPLAIRLDVRGAKTLTLVVDFADFGDVQGHVNWADARLIK